MNLATNGRRVRLGPFRWLLGGLIIAAVMTIEEISQLWIPTRTCDPGDLIANFAGVMLAAFAWKWVRPARRKSAVVPGRPD